MAAEDDDDISEEETAVGEAAADETVVVPGARSGTFTEWAWSADDAAIPVRERHPLPRPLLVLLAAVVVAAIGLAAFVVGRNSAQPASSPTTTVVRTVIVSSTPPSSLPVSPSTTAANPMPTGPMSNSDRLFLRGLNDRGLAYQNADYVISLAHQVCERLAAMTLQIGIRLHNEAPVAFEFAQREWAMGWAMDDWEYVVGKAVSTYCPEYA